MKRINPDALVVKSIHKAQHFYKLSDGRLVDIEQLKNKKIALLSTIGNPSSFERTIANLGLRVDRHFAFRDHYWYKKEDLQKLDNYCARYGIDTIITTEKDAVKLRITDRELRIANLLVLRIKLEIIENEKGFYNRLFGIYNS